MNWFERHLNWTAIIIPPISIVLGFMLGQIYLYLTGQDVFNVLLPGEFGFLATAILLSIGVTWEIRKKNLETWLYVYFLPLFLVAVIGQMMTTHYYVDNLGEQPILIIAFFASILWIVGWITLMTSRVGSMPHPDSLRFPKIARKVEKYFGWVNRPFKRFPRLIYLTLFIVIASIIILGILSGNSYVERDKGYTLFSENISSFSSNITFTFEYPRCFRIWPNDGPIRSWNTKSNFGLYRDKRTWFAEDMAVWIDVEANRPEDFLFSPSMSLENKAMTYLHDFFSNTDIKIDFLDIEEISVAGLPAEYVTLSIKGEPGYFFKRTLRFAYFENNYLGWVITMNEDDSQNVKYFDHLLQTFKITDN